jgi:lipoteichoic acid synthase
MVKRKETISKKFGSEDNCGRTKSTKIEKGRLSFLLPNAETILLFAGIIVTLLAKKATLAGIRETFVLSDLVSIIIPDLLFFLTVYMFFCILYLLRPSRAVARLVLIVAALIVLWSFLNALWLIRSGVQLQPGVLVLFGRDIEHLWPLVQNHLIVRPRLIITVIFLFFLVGGVICWRLVIPVQVSSKRNIYAYRFCATLLVIALIVLVKPAFAAFRLSSQGEVFGFSSHFNALSCVMRYLCSDSNDILKNRNIPTSGKREITLLREADEELPNIVVVLLESISHDAFSRHPEAMPFLHSLADDGVEFTKTRAPVSHTTKALWAVMTGSDPVIQPDYVEAVPSVVKYETLATILSRYGYRSAFFQTAKGTFECAPGLCSNLGFDWAWFRENIEDKSAHLGYLGADDCRMIRPALEWIEREQSPFLVVMITSVSHDPYDVPSWFAGEEPNPYKKYINSLSYTDYFLRQFKDKLTTSGLNDNTMFIIIGDHGTGFEGDRNQARWRPLEKVIRVPWLIHWPGHFVGCTKIDWPVSQIDVTPTVLKLIGFDFEDSEFQGLDALLVGDPQRRFYFSSWYRNSPLGFVQGERKVVYWPYQDKVFEFNLTLDPEEKNPIEITSEPSIKIKQQIIEWQQASKINIDAKKHTQQLLYNNHWQTFSIGEKAWAYYIPESFRQN